MYRDREQRMARPRRDRIQPHSRRWTHRRPRRAARPGNDRDDSPHPHLSAGTTGTDGAPHHPAPAGRVALVDRVRPTLHRDARTTTTGRGQLTTAATSGTTDNEVDNRDETPGTHPCPQPITPRPSRRRHPPKAHRWIEANPVERAPYGLPRFCHESNRTHLIEEHIRDFRTCGIMRFRSARLASARFQIPPSPPQNPAYSGLSRSRRSAAVSKYHTS